MSAETSHSPRHITNGTVDEFRQMCRERGVNYNLIYSISPKATKSFTSEELRKMGLVSIQKWTDPRAGR